MKSKKDAPPKNYISIKYPIVGIEKWQEDILSSVFRAETELYNRINDKFSKTIWKMFEQNETLRKYHVYLMHRYFIEKNKRSEDEETIAKRNEYRMQNEVIREEMFNGRDDNAVAKEMLIAIKKAIEETHIDETYTFKGNGPQNYCSKMANYDNYCGEAIKCIGLNSRITANLGQKIWAFWLRKLGDYNKYGDVIKKKHVMPKGSNPIDVQKNECNGFTSVVVTNGGKTPTKGNNIRTFVGIKLDIDHKQIILADTFTGEKGKALILNFKADSDKINEDSAKGRSQYFKWLDLIDKDINFKTISIRREVIGDKFHYYMRISCEAPSSRNKGLKLGKGRVGIDVGTRDIWFASPKDKIVKRFALSDIEEYNKMFKEFEDKKLEIQRLMSKSEQNQNPKMFDKDGKIIRGSHLKHSNGYKKLQMKLYDLNRRITEAKRASQYSSIKEIVSMGNEFVVEACDYKQWAETGHGKAFSKNAPAQYIQMLGNTIKMLGGKFANVPTYIAATQFDHTDKSFTKRSQKERIVTLSNGIVTQRDAHAAVNLACVSEELFEKACNATGKTKWGGKNADNYNCAKIEKAYSEIPELHLEEPKK